MQPAPVWKPQPLRSWESDTTSLYLRYFDQMSPAYRARQIGEGWGSFAAGS